METSNIIDGKYELLKFIGKGGMAKVYLAMDRRLNKQWAVKKIEKRGKNSKVIIQSALDEANLIKRLDHPTLPRIVDIIENETEVYIVMDYIEGEPLNKIVAENGAQPQEVVIEWAKKLCEVLDYLHTRETPIIYRDMKPGNIMLKPDGNIKLIDFGIAREYKEESNSDTVCLGTRGYAAPEQFGGKGQTDARTDIYCLGATLYHLVTGHNPAEYPYEMRPIREWNEQLSGGLEKIILKATQQNPEDRYSSCVEMLYALEHYEEVDDAYYLAQRSKLKKFILVSVSCILFVLAGISAIVVKNGITKEDYNKYVLQGQKASNSSEKIQFFEKAIEVDPTKTQAYMEMIDVFKEDAVFSLEEEEKLKKNTYNNLSELTKDEDYALLAFEIGKIYWYYYDYGKEQSGDNQVTRMKSAIQWFEDVTKYSKDEDSDYYKMSMVYANIGKFNRDITLNIEEAGDKGLYIKYWKDVEELMEISKNDDNEIVKLEIYKLVIYSIENYARKLKSDGVEKKSVCKIYEDVKKSIEKVYVSSDKIDALKKDITSRFENVEFEINNIYEED